MAALTELTPAQKKRQEKLAADAARVAGGGTDKTLAPEPVPLHVMLSEGITVTIGGEEYEAAPLPIAKLGKVGPLLGVLSDALTLYAMTAFETGQFDVAATAAKLNSLVDLRGKMAAKVGLEAAGEGGEPVEVTAEAIELLLDAVISETTEAEAAAMVDLTLLVLSRRHPDLTREEIEAELEMPAFLLILVSLYAGSPTLRRTFRPA